MNDETLDELERQLAGLPPHGAPAALRRAVLADVRQELRSARWDRRLARAAAVLLIVGVGINGAIVMKPHTAVDQRPMHVAGERSPESLAETAALVADATDAETGRRFARHLVAMSGRELTVDEAAAIDAAIEHRHSLTTSSGGDG